MLRVVPALLALLLWCPAHLRAEPAPPESSSSTADGHVQLLEYVEASAHPTKGPALAPVTIEVFLFLRNPQSLRLHRDLLALHARHPQRLRIVYHLTDRGPQRTSMAQIFGREAFEQGRFFPFMKAFYGNRQRPPVSKDFPAIAKEAGVDYDRVTAAEESMRHDEVLQANYYLLKRRTLSHVPSLVINGHAVPRPGNLERLEQLYDQAYDRAMTLLASGVAPNRLLQRLRQQEEAERDPRHDRLSGPLDGGHTQSVPPTSVPMSDLLRGEHRRGPKDAKVIAVFLCNQQTPLCRKMSQYVEALRRGYKDELEVVFHPLYDPETPVQDKAKLMYEATLCADEQDSFWAYYEQVLARRGLFDAGMALAIAASPAVDLDLPRFESCLETGRQAARAEAEVALVRRIGVQYTPSLAIGGVLYSGRLVFEDMRVLVEAQLAPGLLGRLAAP